jgi:glycosyltransferase involved in cell wall biosynthesis
VRLALTRAKRVVALWTGSADVLREHLGVPSDSLRVVPNGVPADRFPLATETDRSESRRAFGVPAGARVVAVLGALVPEKGVDLVVDAVAGIDDAHLLVAGDGPDRDALHTRADATGLSDRVSWLGSVPDPHPVLAATDVVALASRGGDSMPAVLIEGGLTGRAVVTTPVGAAKEMILDGETGRIVPIEDVGALRAAFEDLLAEPDQADAFGRAGRRRCLEQYEIEPVAEGWDGVLREASGVVPPRLEPLPARRDVPQHVTVIVPVLDAQDTIGAQLQALADQETPVPFDVVVADNGSCDATAAVARRWSEQLDLQILDASTRPGSAHARNVAVAAATGDLLCFCDADDVVAPGWLAALIESARRADLVAGALEVRTLNSASARRWRPVPAPATGRRPAFAPSGSMAMWADAYRSIGGFDESYPKSHDVELSRRAVDAGLVLGWAPDAFVAYRLRSDLRGLARQSWRGGRASMQLAADAGDGIPPLRGELRRAASLLVRLPTLATTVGRGRWVRTAALLGGRLEGRLRFTTDGDPGHD